MNIVIMPSWYKSGADDTTGSFFTEQAKALADYGHTVSVISFEFISNKYIFNRKAWKTKPYLDNGINTHVMRFPSFKIDKICKNYSHYFFYKRMLTKFLSKGDVDVIHVHSFFVADIAIKLGKKYGIPVVLTEHFSGILRKTLNKKLELSLKNAVNNSDAVIAVSESLKKALSEYTNSKNITVIPNMVSSLFDYSPKINSKDSYHSDENKHYYKFFSCGNLIPLKKFDLLINAFSKAFPPDEKVRLEIAGEGIERKKLTGLIKSHGRENQITLLGKKTREGVAALMSECDSFVLVSETETFGVVYVEALASGKPVIGTKNGGAEDIIKPHNGLLIEKNNETELINALKYLKTNSDKYNPKSISDDCLKLYKDEVIAEKLTRIYEEVCRTDKPKGD